MTIIKPRAYVTREFAKMANETRPLRPRPFPCIGSRTGVFHIVSRVALG